jgi:hypothetical protein
MNGNAMLRPALWGALVIGVLSGLPLVSVGNCCCCAWIVSGGMLAAYLLQNNTPAPITMGDGALVGLLAGVMSSLVNLVVSVPMNILMGPVQQRLFQRLLQSQPDMPDNVRQMFDNMGGSAVSVIGVAVGFVVMLILGAVFASLGGLLGAFFFKKKAVPFQPPAATGTI